VSKGLFGGQVWAAPARLRAGRPNVLTPVGTVGRLVTDGAFLPDGRHVVLRDYGSATLYDAKRWRPLARMELPAQRQGEGLVVDRSGRRLLLSTEGRHSAVLSVPMSTRMLAALDSQASGSQGSPSVPAGSTDGSRDAGDGLPLPALAVAAGITALGALGVRALLRGRAQRRSTT
jgi:hypothetical protein